MIAGFHRGQVTFEQVLPLFQQDLWLYLCFRANNRQDAEDIMSQVTSGIWMELSRGKQPDDIVGYAMGMARYRLSDFYRRPSQGISPAGPAARAPAEALPAAGPCQVSRVGCLSERFPCFAVYCE